MEDGGESGKASLRLGDAATVRNASKQGIPASNLEVIALTKANPQHSHTCGAGLLIVPSQSGTLPHLQKATLEQTGSRRH